ncbi:MAG TPA: hypothetical protein VLC28_14355 [Flavitalea sp.]|nr:hypothetical protein [Flavitalea sp.]
MPYANSQRLSKFYSQAFGWQMQKLGSVMGDYVTAATAETDENRIVKKPGAINGGFFPKNADAQVPSLVISVDNRHESKKKLLTPVEPCMENRWRSQESDSLFRSVILKATGMYFAASQYVTVTSGSFRFGPQLGCHSPAYRASSILAFPPVYLIFGWRLISNCRLFFRSVERVKACGFIMTPRWAGCLHI